MSVGDIASLGGLVLAVLVSIGGGLRWMVSLRSGGDLITELRKQVTALEDELKVERSARENDSKQHREDLDDLRREHKGEIDSLQQEVRRLMMDRH